MDSQSSQSVDEYKEDNFLTYSQNSQNQKQARQRLTILDDIDELNEDINGPGALEDQIKTKQIIQETFDRVQSETTHQKQNQDQNKENAHSLNRSKILIQNARQAKVHGLISYTLKIDLSQPPSDENLFLFKTENSMMTSSHAPKNSPQSRREFNLFSRALETERGHKKFKNVRM